MTYSGLTWDHPRGYDALAEAARRANAERRFPLVVWEKQPLEGFESAPISELAARHDLIVLDHPHIGEAMAEDCLIPLEDLYSGGLLEIWEAQSVGPSLASYRWEEKTYAIPLDVATQAMARRADRIADAPDTWEGVEALAAEQPVALSLGGPHAFLNLISMAAGEGHVVGGDEMLPDDAALSALARLGRLARAAPQGTGTLNPIGLLEAMARGDSIALIPLVFGYVTYSCPGYAPCKVSFSDTICAEGAKGGVLGGTGVGFSRRADPSPELLEHIAWLIREDTQTDFLPQFGGQPSARAAWESATVNEACGNFFAATRATAEKALLRPRFDGYIAFQSKASTLLREAFAESRREEKTLENLRGLWRVARSEARGPLDDERA